LQCCRVQQQQWPPVGSTTPWRKFCFSFRNPPTGVPTLDVPAHRTLRPTHLWIAGDRWWSWLFKVGFIVTHFSPSETPTFIRQVDCHPPQCFWEQEIQSKKD
jgi:hypothetical protein